MKLFKRVIRKIAPLAASALMLVGSVGFAAAADLADFPQPYVDAAGIADVAIIIGADAESQDTIAAVDIQSSLVVPVASSGATTITGGESKQIPLGYNINDGSYGWSTALTDSDISTLLDIDNMAIAIEDVSNDYSAHEEIVFGAGFAVRTGLNITSPHQKYKDRPFFQVASGSITYRYVFDETVKKGNYLSNATTDDSVEMTILGKAIEVTAADKTNGDDFTALVGEKFTLAVGESKTVEGGKIVTLVEVGSGNDIEVDVDGVSDIISNAKSKTINGIRVRNHQPLYTTTEGGISRAVIIAGEKTSKVYDTGKEFIGQDENDPIWKWELSNLHGASDSGKPKINVTMAQTWTTEGDVVFEGESLVLPNDYVTIEFNSLTDGVWQDFRVYGDTIKLYNETGGACTDANGNSGIEWNTSANVLVLESQGGTNTGFKIPSSGGPLSHCQNKETDTLYVYAYKTKNATLYWKDHDDANKAKYCSNIHSSDDNPAIKAQYEDSDFIVNIRNWTAIAGVEDIETQIRIYIGNTEAQNITLTSNTSIAEAGFGHGFGTKDGTPIDTDVIAAGSTGQVATKNLGTWKENTLTIDGLKIYDPYEHGDNNEFWFGLPQDEGTEFRANIHVYGTSASSVTGGTQFTKAPSVTKIDTEITTVKDRNIISVGGSAVNRVSAEILGLTFPTYGGDQAWQDATGVTGEGQALVAVFDSPYATGKVAMLVAGWRGVDSERAGNALYRGVPALSGQSALLSTVTSTVTVL